MRRSITALLTAAVVMGATAAGYAALGGADQGPRPRAKIQPASPVRVSGNTSDLFPGVRTALPIKVRNLTAGPVKLQWVEATVGETKGACGAAYLNTERIWPRQRIPARGRINLVIPITLASQAPDSCQGVKFPLLYRTRVNVLGSGR
jgi:hypothetical protein